MHSTTLKSYLGLIANLNMSYLKIYHVPRPDFGKVLPEKRVFASAIFFSVPGGQLHPRWAATFAVGSNICGGQQLPWWAATFAVGSSFRDGLQHYLRAINLLVGSDICGVMLCISANRLVVLLIFRRFR